MKLLLEILAGVLTGIVILAFFFFFVFISLALVTI